MRSVINLNDNCDVPCYVRGFNYSSDWQIAHGCAEAVDPDGAGSRCSESSNGGPGTTQQRFWGCRKCIFVPEVHSNLSFQAAWAGLILVFLMLCCCCLPWLAGTQIRVHLWDKYARCRNLKIFVVTREPPSPHQAEAGRPGCSRLPDLLKPPDGISASQQSVTSQEEIPCVKNTTPPESEKSWLAKWRGRRVPQDKEVTGKLVNGLLFDELGWKTKSVSNCLYWHYNACYVLGRTVEQK